MSKKVVTDKGISGVVGRNNFFSAETVIKKWNKIIKENRTGHDFQPMRVPKVGISLRYDIETLRNFLENPTRILIYDLGFSLKDILALLSSDFGRQPRHFKNNVWWTFFDEKHWTNQREEPNYYLLETVGIHKNEEWTTQESKIVSDEFNFQRVSTRLMMNLSITHFLLRESYFHRDCHHWGPEQCFNKVRCVSHFNERGFVLFNWGEQLPSEELGTFVIRKFDF